MASLTWRTPVSSRSPLNFTKTRSLSESLIRSKGSWIAAEVSMVVEVNASLGSCSRTRANVARAPRGLRLILRSNAQSALVLLHSDHHAGMFFESEYLSRALTVNVETLL